jgi:RNA polymerase sigma-70 factor (ECF subfamily)
MTGDRERSVGTATDDRVARLREGDASAFEALVRENGSWMLGLARRILADDHEAEDAVQDACLSAFRSVGAFHGDSTLSTWLHRIVVNAALMRLRSRRRRDTVRLDGAASTLPREDRARDADARSASRSLEAREVGEIVRRAIARIPGDYRVILVLRDVEGMDMAEVARLVDLTVSGAKSRLHRARQALREALLPVLPEDRPARLRALG